MASDSEDSGGLPPNQQQSTDSSSHISPQPPTASGIFERPSQEDVVEEEEPPKLAATASEVKAALEKMETWDLQSEDDLRDELSYLLDKATPPTECRMMTPELWDLATSIVKIRKERQRNYRDQLKSTVCHESREIWETKFLRSVDPRCSVPSHPEVKIPWIMKQWGNTQRRIEKNLGPVLPMAIDERYDKWLDADESARLTVPSPVTCLDHQYIARQLDDNARSVYGVNLNKGKLSHSALVIYENGMGLMLICEVGSLLGISPRLFVEHFCGPVLVDRMINDDHDWGVLGPVPPVSEFVEHWSRRVFNQFFWQINGLSFKSLENANLGGMGKEKVKFINDRVLGCREPDYEKSSALIRISGLEIGKSCFFVLVKEAETSLTQLPDNICAHRESKDVAVLSVWTAGLTSMLHWYFSNQWNTRRVSHILTHTPYEPRFPLGLQWILALSFWEKQILNMNMDFQTLDYELMDFPGQVALLKIKERRKSVAQLRREMAATERWMSEQSDRREIFVMINQATKSDPLVTAGKSNDMDVVETQRLAGTRSLSGEWVRLDKEAQNLMLPLNDYLQLIIAENQSTDSRISLKQGQRSTQLTILAAIYLPLSLATGIFGMNIREINGDTLPFWWPIIIFFILMIPSALFIAYIFWRTDDSMGDVESRPTRSRHKLSWKNHKERKEE